MSKARAKGSASKTMGKTPRVHLGAAGPPEVGDQHSIVDILGRAIAEAKRREKALKPIRSATYSRKDYNEMKGIVARVLPLISTAPAMPRQPFMDVLSSTTEQLGLDPSACYDTGHFKQLGFAALTHMATNSSLEPGARLRACICFTQSVISKERKATRQASKTRARAAKRAAIEKLDSDDDTWMPPGEYECLPGNHVAYCISDRQEFMGALGKQKLELERMIENKAIDTKVSMLRKTLKHVKAAKGDRTQIDLCEKMLGDLLIAQSQARGAKRPAIERLDSDNNDEAGPPTKKARAAKRADNTEPV